MSQADEPLRAARVAQSRGRKPLGSCEDDIGSMCSPRVAGGKGTGEGTVLESANTEEREEGCLCVANSWRELGLSE